MYTSIPAITGKQLIKLLQKDRWVVGRRTNHGISLTKPTGKRIKVTVVPDTGASLPIGTLQKILGVKQTSIGKKGLLDLLNKYGV